MSKEQLALNNLQESVQYVHEEMTSKESEKNVDKVEMLQDKFEALLQIIETQAHRVFITILLDYWSCNVCQ